MEPLSIYVHLPYCRARCVYCDFNTYAVDPVPWRSYAQALHQELQRYERSSFLGRPLLSVYFGGGTPSLFPPAFFADFLSSVSRHFTINPDTEITFECNPGTLEAGRAAAVDYLRAGLNRVSVGIQSLNPERLKALGRIHTVEDAYSAVDVMGEAGFQQISVDLMFGVPGQHVEDWQAELELAAGLPITHASVYNLTPVEGTRLAAALSSGEVFLPDEEVLAEMFLLSRRVLRSRGFEAYEISNFSRGARCRHNMAYWRGGEYLGLGAGAHSFSRRPPPDLACSPSRHGIRFWNTAHPRHYEAALGQGRPALEGSESLSLSDAATEMILCALRLEDGLRRHDFLELVGEEACRAADRLLERWLQQGLAEKTDAGFRLSDQGLLIADPLMADLSLEVDPHLKGE